MSEGIGTFFFSMIEEKNHIRRALASAKPDPEQIVACPEKAQSWHESVSTGELPKQLCNVPPAHPNYGDILVRAGVITGVPAGTGRKPPSYVIESQLDDAGKYSAVELCSWWASIGGFQDTGAQTVQ